MIMLLLLVADVLPAPPVVPDCAKDALMYRFAVLFAYCTSQNASRRELRGGKAVLIIVALFASRRLNTIRMFNGENPNENLVSPAGVATPYIALKVESERENKIDAHIYPTLLYKLRLDVGKKSPLKTIPFNSDPAETI